MITLRTELKDFDNFKRRTQNQIKELEAHLQSVTKELRAQKEVNKQQKTMTDVLRNITAETKSERNYNSTTSTNNISTPSPSSAQTKSAEDLFMPIPSNQRMVPLVPYKHHPPTMEISGPLPCLDNLDNWPFDLHPTSENVTNNSVRRRNKLPTARAKNETTSPTRRGFVCVVCKKVLSIVTWIFLLLLFLLVMLVIFVKPENDA